MYHKYFPSFSNFDDKLVLLASFLYINPTYFRMVIHSCAAEQNELYAVLEPFVQPYSSTVLCLLEV
jgi:hypothetical protein